MNNEELKKLVEYYQIHPNKFFEELVPEIKLHPYQKLFMKALWKSNNIKVNLKRKCFKS